jgi:hypothetical protein
MINVGAASVGIFVLEARRKLRLVLPTFQSSSCATLDVPKAWVRDDAVLHI